jgi:hypothetical protein
MLTLIARGLTLHTFTVNWGVAAFAFAQTPTFEQVRHITLWIALGTGKMVGAELARILAGRAVDSVVQVRSLRTSI